MEVVFQIALVFFFLAFAWMAHKKTENGIYTVIFLLPFYLLRFSLGGIPTTALEVMIYLLFASWWLRNRRQLALRKSVRQVYRREGLLAWGITLLWAGVFLATLNSVDMRSSWGILKGWFFDPVLFLVVFTSTIKDKKQLRNVLLSFIGSGLGVALLGVGYALSGSFTFDGRLRAFYESPNYLAMYLAPGLLFAFYLFMVQKKDFEKAMARDYKHNEIYFLLQRPATRMAVLSLLGLALLFTRSYGAVAGVLVAVAVRSVRGYRRQNLRWDARDKKMFWMVAGLGLLIFSFLSYQKYEQIVSSHERSSLHSRLMIWDASREMLEDSPVFGIGPGTFQKVYLDYQSRFAIPYLEWAVAEPHNTFLAFYLQSGLLGLSGFFLILIWLYQRARSSDLVLLFLVYFLIHGAVDTLYWKNDLAVIFFLVVGAGCWTRKNSPTSDGL